jgi:hypothetical protein
MRRRCKIRMSALALPKDRFSMAVGKLLITSPGQSAISNTSRTAHLEPADSRGQEPGEAPGGPNRYPCLRRPNGAGDTRLNRAFDGRIRRGRHARRPISRDRPDKRWDWIVLRRRFSRCSLPLTQRAIRRRLSANSGAYSHATPVQNNNTREGLLSRVVAWASDMSSGLGQSRIV